MFAMTLIVIIIVLLKVIANQAKKEQQQSSEIERLQLKLRIERLSAENARMAMIQMEERMHGDTQEYIVDPTWFEGCNNDGTKAD